MPINLTQRLNNQVHNVADLNTKIKAIEQEKASLLTVIQLLQAGCNHPKVDESKECDSWTKSRTANFRRKTSTGGNKESQLNNNITVSNQYAPLMTDESENNEVIESIKIPETSKSVMKTNKSFRNHTQNRTERKQKQQQNGLKPIQGGSIAIIGDSMLKALNPSKSVKTFPGATTSDMAQQIKTFPGATTPDMAQQISVKTFPGATTSDMNHYVKPTLDRNPKLLVLHVGQMMSSEKLEPQETANEAESLCRSIVRNGMTRIALSEIIVNGISFLTLMSIILIKMHQVCI